MKSSAAAEQTGTYSQAEIGRVQMTIADRDAALMELYRRLVEHGAPKPGSFSALDDAGRRAYFTEARRRNRARERKAQDAGAIEPNLANIRDALADAALMMLATDAPGADHVRAVLAQVFAARPGAPMTIETRARRGKLKPKLLRMP